MGDEVQAALLQEQAGELLPPSALPSLSIQRRQRNSKFYLESVVTSTSSHVSTSPLAS